MERFYNLSLRWQILLVVVPVLLINFGVVGTAYIGVVDSKERENWVDHTNKVMVTSKDLVVCLLQMELGERGFVMTGDENFLTPYNEGLKCYNDKLAALNELVDDNASQKPHLVAIDEPVKSWRTETLEKMINLRKEINAGRAQVTDIAPMTLQVNSKAHMDKVEAELAAFNLAEVELLNVRLADARQASEQVKLTLIFGMTGALIMGLGIALVVATGIAKRINQVAQAADQMANGHLEATANLPKGADEVGKLANAFIQMATTIRSQITAQEQANADLQETIERLNGLTNQLKNAIARIAAAATEIMSATTQQASSATEQSAAINQATTGVEEVKSIALQTAQKAEQIAQDGQKTLAIAQQGTQAVEGTIEGMGQIRERVETIARTILDLSKQTQEISFITTTVSELADQSNLLALNAAIEAARAGEQGRSFAVVAGNVRELAERSKEATAQVQTILREIQRATNAAVLVTEEGTKGVENGVRLAMAAGGVIHQIANEIEQGAQSNTQMAIAAQQQTTGMEQIGQAMREIQQATTQSLASTRQTEAAARDLHTVAQSLQRTLLQNE